MVIERSVQTTLPTQTLHCHLATPLELKLFDKMLLYDYRHRTDTGDVTREVEIIEANYCMRRTADDLVDIEETMEGGKKP